MWYESLLSKLTVLPVTSTQSARESSEVQDELSEKVDRLKAELVVFKSLMSDVSIGSEWWHHHFSLSFSASDKVSVNSHSDKHWLNSEWLFLWLSFWQRPSDLNSKTKRALFSLKIYNARKPPKQAFSDNGSNSSWRTGAHPAVNSLVLFPVCAAPV